MIRILQTPVVLVLLVYYMMKEMIKNRLTIGTYWSNDE
jgi:hypothetical protein